MAETKSPGKHSAFRFCDCDGGVAVSAIPRFVRRRRAKFMTADAMDLLRKVRADWLRAQLDEVQMQRLGLWETTSRIRTDTGRPSSTFVIFEDEESLTDRGPNLKIP